MFTSIASRSRSATAFLRCLFALALLASSAAHADYSQIVVFGDSLSDNGNLFRATGMPSAPYVGGRFSNGPVAVENLAARVGVSLDDHAWGGATTGVGNTNDGGDATHFGALFLPGVATQVGTYLSATATTIDPRALYIVWAGPNDFLSGLAGYATNPAAGAAAITLAVNDLVSATAALAQRGGLNFVVPLMVDLGITTRAYAGGPAAVAGANQFSQLFNGALSLAMQQLSASIPGSIALFDTYTTSRDLYFNAAAYGITNVTEPCLNASAGSVCANPDQYYFWDEIHPTARVHALVGERFFAAVVPEPQAWMLMIVGLGIFVWRTARR